MGQGFYSLSKFKEKAIFQSAVFPEGVKVFLFAIMLFNGVELHLLEIILWTVGTTVCCFIVTLCQLGISNGSFTVPQLYDFFY